MAVNSASGKIFASYGSVISRTEPSTEKITDEHFKNAVPIQLDRLELSDEEVLKRFWGAEITETTADDGTVTKSVSGKASFIGKYGSGTTAFRVGVCFQSSTYQPGQLGDAIDLLAAAYEVKKRAMREALSGAELERQSARLEAAYQEQKNEAAGSFAEMVNGQEYGCGQTGEPSKIYRSIQALFTSFEAKYQVIAADSDPDNWMDADILTSAVRLQKIGMTVRMDDQRAKGLFTLQELEFAALRVRGRLNLRA